MFSESRFAPRSTEWTGRLADMHIEADNSGGGARMRFGVSLHGWDDVAGLLASARRAEADGLDVVTVADHLGAPAPFQVLAAAATVTEPGLPPVRWLEPHQPVKGWVAASLYSLKLGSLGRPGHDDFAWLERHDPVARVGKSIRLYYIP